MKREDIEKAAKDYSIGKTYFRRNVLKEVDADNYVLRKGNCSEDFIAGAEWQADSIHHRPAGGAVSAACGAGHGRHSRREAARRDCLDAHHAARRAAGGAFHLQFQHTAF